MATTSFSIRRASKQAGWARVSLFGPSGSGRTTTALQFAFGLLGQDVAASKEFAKDGAAKVIVIDSERGKSQDLAPVLPPFDVLVLPNCNPLVYVEAINHAQAQGYEALVIDGLSQAWSGPGGVLETVDRNLVRFKNDRAKAWAEVQSEHDQLYRCIANCKMHVVVTFRAKKQLVVDRDDNGHAFAATVVMEPIAKAETDFDFDFVFSLTPAHRVVIEKTRLRHAENLLPADGLFRCAQAVALWAGQGETPPVEEIKPTPTSPTPVSTGAETPAPAGASVTNPVTSASTTTPSAEHPTPGDLSPDARYLKDIIEKVGFILGEKQELANRFFRTCGKKKWINAQQTWRDLPKNRLEDVLAKRESFLARLDEFAAGERQAA